MALIFHLLFRSLAIVAYVFANWVFASKFILGSVIIILCLAFDFWTVKNVTGRLLVGLRWWNEIKEDGSNVWIFESKEVPFTELLQNESYTLMLQQNRQVNAVDSRIFWYSMYITLTTWVVFAFVAIIGLKVSWAVLSLVAVFMNMANVIGYTKCEKV